jgi:antitoxin YefM
MEKALLEHRQQPPPNESGTRQGGGGLAVTAFGMYRGEAPSPAPAATSAVASNTYTNPYRPEIPDMDAITYTAARANLASTMDRVCQDHEPLIITRNGQPSVVMLSMEDYQSLEETAFLLRSPENAKRLLSAVESLSKGKGQERQLTA